MPLEPDEPYNDREADPRDLKLGAGQ
jgi:hypothetical protein